MNAFQPGDVAALLSSEFCVRLTQALLHFLWQGLFIGLLVLMIDRFGARASSRFRYAAGVAALVAMLACVPATYFAIGMFWPKAHAVAVDHEPAPIGEASPSADVVEATTQVVIDDAQSPKVRGTGGAEPGVAGSTSEATSFWTWQALTSLPARLAPYATLAYLLGVAIMLARLTLALRSGHALRQSAMPLSDPAILAMAARQSRRIGLKVVPVVAWCQRAAVPLVVGIVKPVILLPTAIASGLSPDQLESLLAHELAHLKRLDLLVNLAQRLAESFLFFHPAVWYVSRRISIERENCCDDCVLAAGWGRVEYADALVRMAEVCAAVRGLTGLEGASLLAASGESPSQFKRRVLRLLEVQSDLRVGISRGWLLAALGGVLLTLALLPFAANWKGRAEAGQAEQAQPAAAEAPALEEAALPDVHSSLKFLASRQNDDGSFGSGEFPLDRSPALTAICGLAMLRGDVVWDPGPTKTPGFSPAKYAAHRDKAIEFLLNRQRDSGLLAGADQPSNALMYDHAFAMWFLAEAQRIPGRTPDLTEPLAKAVALSVSAQNKEGGWRYLPKPDDADAHVTAVQLLALSAARRAKVEVPQEAIDKAIAYLKRCREEGSRGFAYQPGLKNAAYHRSAAALAALALAGADDEWLKPGLDYLVNHAGDERQFDPELYLSDGRYFAVEALRRLPGYAGHARRLHKQFRTDLLRERHADGSWREPRIGAEGPTAWACLLLLAAPSPEELKRDQAARREKRFFRGKDALARIDEGKPAWSETQEGVQFGVAIVGDKRQFSSGERVPLEMFVRNVGKEGVEITLSAEFLGNVPEVKNAAGEAVPIERAHLLGTVALYREFLKSGEAFGFRHPGVGLGSNPHPGEKSWHPYWAEPQPGKYTLRHTHRIGVDPANELIRGKRVRFTSGAVEFEVVEGGLSHRQPGRDDASRTLQAALLDRQEYVEGTFPTEERLIKSEVLAAEQALSKAQASFESSKRLAAKGFITAAQLQAAEAAAKQAQAQLELAQGKLDVLRRFTKEKLLRELDRKVIAALESLLDQLVTLKVTDKPVISVLSELEKAHGVPVTIDLKEVHARGLSAQTKVTIDAADKPLREVFTAVLASAGLTFAVTEKGICVPAKAKAPPAADADKPAGPAQIHVHYDIPGAEKEGQIFVQHIGGRDIIGTADHGHLKTNPVTNGQTLALDKLDPGDYQVARHRLIFIGGLGMSRFLDRQRFQLAAGETKSIDFSRPKGQPLHGKVLGLKEAGLSTAVVNICADNAKDDRSVGDLDVTLFDSRLCAADGTFKTEQLAPGRYKIVVEGYVVTPERLLISGVIRPSYLGILAVTIPETGEAPMVAVKLEDAEKVRAAAKAGARLEIHYDIPGAEARGRFVVEGPSGSIGSEKIGTLYVNYVNNGKSLSLDHLPAGKYQVTRYRTLMMEEAFGLTRFLDRKQFELAGGDSKTLEFSRPGGKRVSGKIGNLAGKGINKVLVNVCAGNVEGRESLHKTETTIFDALLAQDAGSFTTEPLPPGKYTIVAEGYLPLTPEQRVRTGDIEPRYVGIAKFTVPETGELQPVEVKLQAAVKGEPATTAKVEGWGDLAVQFIYDAPPPQPTKLPVARDTAVFGTELADESLLVGDQGGLANVAVYVSTADVPVHPAFKRQPERTAELTVSEAGTKPRILPFMVSHKLKLTNDTLVGVNFKWEGQANSGFNVLVRSEDAREWTLNKAERVPLPVTDSIHPWLLAYLLPLDHPYAAVSGTDGTAKLANLPAGEWTFRFWHEKAGYLKSADGQREFRIKIEPGENRLKLRVSPEFAVAAAAGDPEQGTAPGQEILFQDDFRSGLSDKWEIVGLDKADYRVRNGGLELRVQPGKLSRDTPMLQVRFPFTSAESIIASVKVTLLDDFTGDQEFAGVFLLDDDGREFAAKKQVVDGKLVFAPGSYEFKGKPGQEGDPANYSVKYMKASVDAGSLRIVIDRGHAFFQVGPSAEGKFLNFFHSAIKSETNQRGFALTAAGAPPGSSHWVRFEDFRVFRR